MNCSSDVQVLCYAKEITTGAKLKHFFNVEITYGINRMEKMTLSNPSKDIEAIFPFVKQSAFKRSEIYQIGTPQITLLNL